MQRKKPPKGLGGVVSVSIYIGSAGGRDRTYG